MCRKHLHIYNPNNAKLQKLNAIEKFRSFIIVNKYHKMDPLRIVSYNCYGLKSSTVDLYELCNKYDIVFLQETLLFKHELNLLSKVHPDCEGMGISAIDDTCNILSGRPYGGLAILIRRKIRPICDFIFYDDTRIMGIQIKNRDECLYFVNVSTLSMSG